jgi:hypothetical protein
MMTQRWTEKRTRFRPAHETIRTAEYDVAPITTDGEAKNFILEHHYSGTYPAARYRYGLYRHGVLVGTAVFSHPCSNKVLTNVFPYPTAQSVELGRFVLLDEVPGNGESWFIARCFEQLRRDGVRGVVSFSDPVPRTNHLGETIFPGHLGIIYQATNGAFLGRGTARTLSLLPDGTVFSDRAKQKIRAGEQGWRYSARILEAWGAPPCPEEFRTEWLNRSLATTTRKISHPGNLKYAWALHRDLELPRLPYLKVA